MASYLETFHSGIRTKVVTAWPEVLRENGGGGIWHGLELASIPWEKMVSGVGLPVAALDVDLQSADWGADNAAYEGPVSIYYITTAEGMVETLAGKLELLRDRLWSEALDFGQVLDAPNVSWSMDLMPNRYFLGTQKPFVAGVVRARCLVGEMAS